jgi:hypothetical protein
MGLLTIDKYYRGRHYLKIPNYSIKTLYWDYLTKIIAEDNNIIISTDTLNEAIYTLAYEGKLQPYVDYISNYYFSKLSNRDLIRFDEKYIKFVLMSGFLLNNTLTLASEREIENGYIDIFLQQDTSVTDVKYQWVWELKYLKASDKDKLPNIKKQATKQLQKYKQAELFKNETDVKFAAIIFIGKDKYEIVEVE